MIGRPDDAANIVILCGAGLSVAAGVPRFHEQDATWHGHRVGDLATLSGWHTHPDEVRAFYDDCRAQLAAMLPTPAHDAVARLQARWGPSRVTLITQNIDALLEKAGAPAVIDVHGCLMRLACEADATHPAVGVSGNQSPTQRCRLCSAPMRPDVTWFGELPRFDAEVNAALRACRLFLSVGASSESRRATAYAQLARDSGARTVEINPKPTGGPFDDVLAEPAADALARLVGSWLDEA